MAQLQVRHPSAGTTEQRSRTERALGLPQSTALIMGSIIGVGIFSLPYSLASYGPISLLAMGLATVGALSLAWLFAVMARRMPADGGPYAYARAAFGNGLGFANAWSYWVTAWAGNAAIVVGWVYYVEHFVNKGGRVGWSIFIALLGLWIPAAVNLTGVRNMGVFQVWTTVLKFIPLALMATAGLLFVKAGNFTPWNTSGDTNLSAIGGAMAICLFSYLGVETAAVAAAKVRGTERVDDDLRGNAAGRGEGRALPPPVRSTLRASSAGLRHHRVHGARVRRHGDQLHGHQRLDGVHDAGADDRHHGRDPVRVLGTRPDRLADP